MTNESEPGDLDLVPTEQLIQELFRRFDAVVLLFEQLLNDREDRYYFRWHGSLAQTAGLLAYGCHRVNETMSRMAPTDDGKIP